MKWFLSGMLSIKAGVLAEACSGLVQGRPNVDDLFLKITFCWEPFHAQFGINGIFVGDQLRSKTIFFHNLELITFFDPSKEI